MIPGVSRSAASIIGGMQQKLTRSAAAEFSFFLAVPTMLAATVYKLYKYTKENGMFTTEQVKLLSIGNAVAFIVAMLAIKFFITFLKKYGFRVWGVYRIIVGIALLAMIFGGWIS
jgi:undecaprenyl-diphosphatase